MDEGAAAWSKLGSTMSLPSVVRDEIEQLKLELRDLKLEVSRDLMALRGSIESIVEQLGGIVDKHHSMVTRVEGLEVRAQGIGAVQNENPFNAFAYVSLEELEDSQKLNSMEWEELVQQPEVTVEPVGPDLSEEDSSDKEFDVLESSDEDVAAYFIDRMKSYIDEHGQVFNNVMYAKVMGGRPSFNPNVKKLIKAAIEADDFFDFVKVDKFRSVIYRAGTEPEIQ